MEKRREWCERWVLAAEVQPREYLFAPHEHTGGPRSVPRLVLGCEPEVLTPRAMRTEVAERDAARGRHPSTGAGRRSIRRGAA